MIIGINDELPFSESAKYDGYTVCEILEEGGKDYLHWCVDNTDIIFSEEVEEKL